MRELIPPQHVVHTYDVAELYTEVVLHELHEHIAAPVVAWKHSLSGIPPPFSSFRCDGRPSGVASMLHGWLRFYESPRVPLHVGPDHLHLTGWLTSPQGNSRHSRAVYSVTAHLWLGPILLSGHKISGNDRDARRARTRRRSASPKKGASSSQRLEACEELRSQEIPGPWAGHDQRCHVRTLPLSQRLCCRMTSGAQDRHRAMVIIWYAGADSTDSGASLSIELCR
jgi:hypothetical protein